MIVTPAMSRHKTLLAALAAGILCIGQPALAQDSSPAPSWSVGCGSPDRAATPTCHMTQRVVTEKGALVMVVEIDTAPNTAGPRLTVLVPLQAYLPDGVTISVDGKEIGTYPLRTCDQHGCVVRETVAKEVIDRFKAGAKLSVAFTVPGSGNRQTVTVPLAGFTAAYGRIAL